jgi:hypothetical protein
MQGLWGGAEAEGWGLLRLLFVGRHRLSASASRWRVLLAMNDLLTRPTTAFLWWCLPLAIGIAGGYSGLSPRGVAAIWAAAFAVMGTGCILNTIRCRRLHCYIAGPVFVLGALAEGFVASGGHIPVPHAQNNIAGAALVLALLSFVPEGIRGRYVR